MARHSLVKVSTTLRGRGARSRVSNSEVKSVAPCALGRVEACGSFLGIPSADFGFVFFREPFLNVEGTPRYSFRNESRDFLRRSSQLFSTDLG